MSEYSNWQNKVKQGLFNEEIFTNEMKISVLEAADRNPKYSFRLWKSLAGVIIVCMTAGVLFLSWSSVQDQTAASMSPALTEGVDGLNFPLTFKLLEARNLEEGEVTINEDDPDILPGLSNKYNPLENRGYTEQIPFSDIELIEQKEVKGFGTALHYILKPTSVSKHKLDREFEAFGFTIDGLSRAGTLFNYGTGHMYNLEMNMTRLFGQELLKIEQPICRTDGEACVWYLKKDAEGMSTYLQIQAATYEQDLDGDGREEAVVVTHKQNQIYLFKEAGGQLLWASVREALNAGKEDIIQYDDLQGIFTIHSFDEEKGESVSTYRYAAGEDVLVHMEN